MGGGKGVEEEGGRGGGREVGDRGRGLVRWRLVMECSERSDIFLSKLFSF